MAREGSGVGGCWLWGSAECQSLLLRVDRPPTGPGLMWPSGAESIILGGVELFSPRWGSSQGAGSSSPERALSLAPEARSSSSSPG